MDLPTKIAIGLFLFGAVTWLADFLFGEDIKAVSRHARIYVFLFGLALILIGLAVLWWWPSPAVAPAPIATSVPPKAAAPILPMQVSPPAPKVKPKEPHAASPSRRTDALKSQVSPDVPQNSFSPAPLDEEHPARRFLTVAAKRELLSEIVSLKSEIPNIVINRASSGDSSSYMMDFVDVFDRAGITVVTGFEEPSGPEETGVMIAVPDLKNIPAIAGKLRRALARIGIETRLIALPANATQSSVVIFIGPEPLPSDGENHKPQKPECPSVTSNQQSGGVTACDIGTVSQ